MMSKLALACLGLGFAGGFLTGWVATTGDEMDRDTVAVRIDTVYEESGDTLSEQDTTSIEPEIVYVPRLIRDTLRDTVYAEAVALRQYDTENEFDDGAWVRHRFGIDYSHILRTNMWDYKPPPQTVINRELTVEKTPSTAKKILKTAGWVAAGAGVMQVINNNK